MDISPKTSSWFTGTWIELLMISMAEVIVKSIKFLSGKSSKAKTEVSMVLQVDYNDVAIRGMHSG